MWSPVDPLVGQRVVIYTTNYDSETGVVLAVSTTSGVIRVRADEDGKILTGNQWDHAD